MLRKTKNKVLYRFSCLVMVLIFSLAALPPLSVSGVSGDISKLFEGAAGNTVIELEAAASAAGTLSIMPGSEITLRGNGNSLSGGLKLELQPGSSVSLEDVSITGGLEISGGKLQLKNVTIVDSSLGVQLKSTTMYAQQTDFSGVTLRASQAAVLTFGSCYFNRSNIIQDSGSLTVEGCVFEAGSAAGKANGHGGSISLEAPSTALLSFDIKNSLFDQNSAQSGGSVFLQGLTGLSAAVNLRGSFTNCVFYRNTSSSDVGGAIGAGGGIQASVDNCSFFGNRSLASRGGGAIGVIPGTGRPNVDVANSLFAENGSANTAVIAAAVSSSHVNDRGGNLGFDAMTAAKDYSLSKLFGVNVSDSANLQTRLNSVELKSGGRPVGRLRNGSSSSGLRSVVPAPGVVTSYSKTPSPTDMFGFSGTIGVPGAAGLSWTAYNGSGGSWLKHSGQGCKGSSYMDSQGLLYQFSWAGAPAAFAAPGSADLSKDGAVLAGWSSLPGGSQTHAPGSNVKAGSLLYALWEQPVKNHPQEESPSPSPASYTLSYSANGGENPPQDANRYEGEATVMMAGNMKGPHGMRFDCWNTKANGKGSDYTAGQTIAMIADTILYAIWKQDTVYKLEYNANGGQNAPKDKNGPYLWNEEASILDGSGMLPPGSGLSFGGWNSSADGTGKYYRPGRTVVLDKDTVLYAIWDTAAAYTLSYDANTGWNPPSDSGSYAPGEKAVVKSGSAMEIPDRSRSFGSWNTKRNGSGDRYMPGDSIVMTANTVLYAQWGSAASYTVKYDANGGQNPPTDKYSPYFAGSRAVILDGRGMESPQGMKFVAWNTRQDGTGTDYFAMDEISIDQNILLFAKWQKPVANGFTVSYSANGGQNPPVDYMSYQKGDLATLRSGRSMTSPEGYMSFTCWNTRADGSGLDYYAGEEMAVEGDITLYAKWQLSESYSIKYLANGGQHPPEDKRSYKKGDRAIILSAVNMTAPEGREFLGWNTRNDGSGTDAYPGQELSIEGNLTLYAKWSAAAEEPEKFELKYDANKGSNPPVDEKSPYGYEDISYVMEQGDMQPPKADMVFDSWNTGPDGGGTQYRPGDRLVIIEELTLYAMWKPAAALSIVYNANGGENPPTDINSYFVGETAAILGGQSMTCPEGKDAFDGWNTRADGNGQVYKPGQEVELTQSLLLYAQWKTIKPSLEKELHNAYINGYPDGSFGPGKSITREETAAMFYRLLTEESREFFHAESNGFSDVRASGWANTAISTMANAGILKGYSNGRFAPTANITRGEFATIAARFSSQTAAGENRFWDVGNHWAKNEINLAASLGWIQGYNDGSFRADRAITRAETVTIINRMLNRKAYADSLSAAKSFKDCQNITVWYYYDVAEAASSHGYTRREDGREVWEAAAG